MPTKEEQEAKMFFISETEERIPFFPGDFGMEIVQTDEEYSQNNLNFGKMSGEFSCEISMTELEFIYLLYANKMQNNNWRKMHGIPKRRSYKK